MLSSRGLCESGTDFTINLAVLDHTSSVVIEYHSFEVVGEVFYACGGTWLSSYKKSLACNKSSFTVFSTDHDAATLILDILSRAKPQDDGWNKDDTWSWWCPRLDHAISSRCLSSLETHSLLLRIWVVAKHFEIPELQHEATESLATVVDKLWVSADSDTDVEQFRTQHYAKAKGLNADHYPVEFYSIFETVAVACLRGPLSREPLDSDVCDFSQKTSQVASQIQALLESDSTLLGSLLMSAYRQQRFIKNGWDVEHAKIIRVTEGVHRNAEAYVEAKARASKDDAASAYKQMLGLLQEIRSELLRPWHDELPLALAGWSIEGRELRSAGRKKRALQQH